MAVTVSVPALLLVKLLAPTSRFTTSGMKGVEAVWLARVTSVLPLYVLPSAVITGVSVAWPITAVVLAVVAESV